MRFSNKQDNYDINSSIKTDKNQAQDLIVYKLSPNLLCFLKNRQFNDPNKIPMKEQMLKNEMG